MQKTRILAYFLVALSLVLAGCTSAPKRSVTSSRSESTTPQPMPSTASNEEPASQQAQTKGKGGGYYLDDGPGDNPPANFDAIPDATPQKEALNKFANKPYMVMGRTYTPFVKLEPYKVIGIASWYGKRFHGQKTAAGENYDMYGMTAAHPTLPIPSYVRVTHLKSGKSVIVRVNDRGPFRRDRLIDLSFTAAYKLGIIQTGSSLVQVESILPGGKIPTYIAKTKTDTNTDAKPLDEPAPTSDAVTQTVTSSDEAVAKPMEPEKPKPTPEKSSNEGLVYLQLGAFKIKENAEAYLTSLRKELTSLAQTMQLFTSGGLTRISLGPYASREEAKQASAAIARKINITPLISIR